MPFTRSRDNFDPETLRVLNAAFNEAWNVLESGGIQFDREATRTALADIIIKFASQGEIDPDRLKALALTALPNYVSG